MTEQKKTLVILLFALFALSWTLWSQGAVSYSFPLGMDRVDYVAADKATVFVTREPVRGFVLVYKNGQLMTESVDYSSVIGPNKQIITFFMPLSSPSGGIAPDRVSLIYFR